MAMVMMMHALQLWEGITSAKRKTTPNLRVLLIGNVSSPFQWVFIEGERALPILAYQGYA
jgi:TRAP-type uncharacterized transport system substrate-binding protein